MMDIELGLPNANTASAHGHEHYIQEVYEFRMFLNNTAKMVHKLTEANQEFNSSTESAAMKEIKGRMMEYIDEVGKMARIMKEKLRRMIINNVENRKKPGCEKGTSTDITRMPLIIALKTRLKERKSDIQNVGETIRQEYLKVIQRRIFTVTGIELSDEVIRVIDTGSMVQMFKNALQGISAEQMVAAVDEIKEWHAAVADFDKKILQVQENFEEMAALVEKREKIDNALEKIDESREKMEKALNEVENLMIRARSTEEELDDEREKNDKLLICMALGLWLLLLGAYLVIFIAVTSG